MAASLLLCAALLATMNSYAPTVSAQYRHEGCYRDNKQDRALQTETATYWLPSKANSIGLCNLYTYRKGYSVFGVQAGGECWSSANASLVNANQTYNKYGVAVNCDSGAGGTWANDVYVVEGPYRYTRVGCFKDNSNRAMPVKVIDSRFSLKSEYKIDLCYLDAAKKGYPVFGVQQEGKCFTGPDDARARKHGPSNACKNGVGSAVFDFLNLASDVYTIFKPQHERVGCFADSSSDRAMPTALGNYQLTRNPEAVRLCYLDAKTRGYSTFGVEDKGKCYSGKDIGSTYKKHGSSSSCSGGKGGHLAIEVYEIGSRRSCSEGWMEEDGLCYKAVESNKYSWYNAKEGCRNEGGSLVKIPALRDQDFMERFLVHGFNADLKTNLFWIGLNDLVNNKFQWTDDKESKFFHWKSGTNPQAAGVDCVAIERSSGRWKLEACSKEYGYICSKKSGGAAVKPSPVFGIGVAAGVAIFYAFSLVLYRGTLHEVNQSLVTNS